MLSNVNSFSQCVNGDAPLAPDEECGGVTDGSRVGWLKPQKPFHRTSERKPSLLPLHRSP